MITIEFVDIELENLVVRGFSNDRFYKTLSRNLTFMKDLKKVYHSFQLVSTASELSNFGTLHYEKLKHNVGLSSVRVGYSSKYRLLFEEFDGGIRIKLIEINKHYGDK